MKRLLLFISILFVSHLLAESSLPKKHVVLFFDVNKTITYVDQSKSLDASINSILSDTTYAKWDSQCKHPISFTSFCNNKQDRENFISLIKEQYPSMYDEVHQKYLSMKIKARCDGPIFASFIHLLDFLEQNDYSYSLILRSYDSNLEPMMQYLMQSYGIPFSSPLRFSGGVLEDDTAHIYDMHIVYEIFKRSPALGILDDKEAWNAHNNEKTYGKPFPINLDEKDVVFCFFDPNINEDPYSDTNVVAAVDVRTNAIISTPWLLQRKMLFKVDPVEALINDTYYIEKVQDAITTQDTLNRRS